MVVTSVIAGASGGALANVALSPLGGGAGLLQSYWYGAGLILGERMMYTFHWEKIKTRLDKGEDFMSVLESEMTPNITAIANFSLEVMKKTGDVYMKGGIDFMAKLIENLFKLLAGESIDEPAPDPCPEGFKRDENGICQPIPDPAPVPDCPTGFRWSASAQQCVPEDIPEPTPDSTTEWTSSFQLPLEKNQFKIMIFGNNLLPVATALWNYIIWRKLLASSGTTEFFTSPTLKPKADALTFIRNHFPHIAKRGEDTYANYGPYVGVSEPSPF